MQVFFLICLIYIISIEIQRETEMALKYLKSAF